MNGFSGLFNTAHAEVPAITRTLDHMLDHNFAIGLANCLTLVSPSTVDEMQSIFSSPLNVLLQRDVARVTELRRHLLPLEVGISEACFLWVTANALRAEPSYAPFNPADLPSEECIDALHALHIGAERLAASLLGDIFWSSMHGGFSPN